MRQRGGSLPSHGIRELHPRIGQRCSRASICHPGIDSSGDASSRPRRNTAHIDPWNVAGQSRGTCAHSRNHVRNSASCMSHVPHYGRQPRHWTVAGFTQRASHAPHAPLNDLLGAVDVGLETGLTQVNLAWRYVFASVHGVELDEVLRLAPAFTRLVRRLCIAVRTRTLLYARLSTSMSLFTIHWTQGIATEFPSCL
jgi:hypothetical protein